jgi:hypothetical protein
MKYKTKAEPKALADKISVFCAFDKIVQIENVKPNPANPNKHPEEQVEKLALNIKTIGWRYPITVSNQSGMIVKGHGRLMAAKLLGLKEVPVDYQNYSNEEEEMADLLFDNRIQELSEIDRKTLLNCFENFDTGNIPFELSGYSEDDYRDLASAFDEYQPKEKPEDPEEEKEVEQKESTFKCCDFKKSCPHYGQKGCSRA